MILPCVMPAASSARWISSGKASKTVFTASPAPSPMTAAEIFSTSEGRKNVVKIHSATGLLKSPAAIIAMSAPQKSKHALKNPFFAPMTAAMMTSATTAMSNIHPNKNTLLFPARLPRALCDTVIIPHYSVCDNVLSASITLRFSFRISRTPSRYTVLSSAMAMLFVSAGTLRRLPASPGREVRGHNGA